MKILTMNFWLKGFQWRILGIIPTKKRGNLLAVVFPLQSTREIIALWHWAQSLSTRSHLIADDFEWSQTQRFVARTLGFQLIEQEMWHTVFEDLFAHKPKSTIVIAVPAIDKTPIFTEILPDWLRMARSNQTWFTLVGCHQSKKALHVHTAFHPSAQPHRDVHYIKRHFSYFQNRKA